MDRRAFVTGRGAVLAADEKAWTAWVRNPQRVVVVR